MGRDNSELISAAKKHLWLSFGRDESYYDRDGAIIASGRGCHVQDIRGNRYLDAMGGQGAAILGYSEPRVVEAMARQGQRILANPSGFPANDLAVELAERLAALTPGTLSRTFFASSGSEANETAVKIARQYHRIRGQGTKYKAIVRWGGYHGSTLAMTAASGYPFRRTPYEPLPAGFVHVYPPHCYRCPYHMTYPQCGIECAREVRRRVEMEDPSTVACYLGELTIAGGGCLPPPPEYVRMVRQVCDEYDMLMITDEVVTGFGRTGTWFEGQQYDVVPDIMTMGKGISAGYVPLSAVHVKEEVAQVFHGAPGNLLQHGYTAGGNPLACAAGLAAIQAIEDDQLISQVPEKHGFLMAELGEIQQASAIVGDVRSRGLMIGIELVRDKATKEGFPDWGAVRDATVGLAKKNGLLVGGFGPTIHMLLPLTITQEELEFVARALARVIPQLEERFPGGKGAGHG